MTEDRKNINEVTILIRGTKENNYTNFHGTVDLDTSTDIEGLVFNGHTYNIRRDSLYTYPPTGFFGIPRRIQGRVYSILRARFAAFTKHPKYEYLCQFEEGCPEPVTHRDIPNDPREAARLLWKIQTTPIFRRGLNEFPEVGKPWNKTLMVIIIVGFIAIAAFMILNSQYHWISGIGLGGTNNTPVPVNGTEIMPVQ